MSDILLTLRKDPANALKSIKPTNPILKDIFLAIPEEERRGVTMPDRGHALKVWLESWATDRLNNRGGDSSGDSQQSFPPPTAAGGPASSLPNESLFQPPQVLEASPNPAEYEQSFMTPVQTQQQQQYRPPSPVSISASNSPSHSHAGSSSGGAACLSCRKKDLTIKKLTALVTNLLEQLDDLALEARGDLTLITSSQG